MNKIQIKAEILATLSALMSASVPNSLLLTDLKNIDDISICNLTSKDVVRHPLVQKIVKAYEAYESKQNNPKPKRSTK